MIKKLAVIELVLIFALTGCAGSTKTQAPAQTVTPEISAVPTATPLVIPDAKTDEDIVAGDGVTLYKRMEKKIPDSYMIDKEIEIECQGANQCYAYSTSMVLRYMGTDISGKKTAKQIDKIAGDASDSEFPAIMSEYIDKKGYKATFCTGTLDSLKDVLVKGNPVIILSRVSTTNAGLHWMLVTGYDKNNIYLADSYMSDGRTAKYNRSVSYEDFRYMWDCGQSGYTQLFFYIR